MTQQDIQSFVDGFAIALQQQLPQERVAAFRALAEKGLRLGVAIDQSPSDQKPVDITLAALDYALQIVNTART